MISLWNRLLDSKHPLAPFVFVMVILSFTIVVMGIPIGLVVLIVR